MKSVNGTMKRRVLLLVTAGLALCGSLSSAAQDKGYWRAASQTATSITGDITISNAKVGINFMTFPIAQIRRLTPAETSAAFDADVNTSPSGTLYRLTVPAAKRLLHRNTLCGSDETEWMATYVSDRTLQVAFFSGDAQPVFTMAALPNSQELCGTFTYVR